MTAESVKFAQSWWDFLAAMSEWEEKFLALLQNDDEDYDSLGTDSYDSSIEIHGAQNNWRLNEEQQRYFYDSGFTNVYVNHLDGWETHYTFDSDCVLPIRGWRRRYVSDPAATTTNVIAGSENNGYYEISFWPQSWESKESGTWLETGYMRIIPDLLDPFEKEIDTKEPVVSSEI